MCRAGVHRHSRRDTDGTTYKMNWRKPRGRGVGPLRMEKRRGGLCRGRLTPRTPAEHVTQSGHGHSSLLMPPHDSTHSGSCGELPGLWTHREGAGTDAIGGQGERRSRPHVLLWRAGRLRPRPRQPQGIEGGDHHQTGPGGTGTPLNVDACEATHYRCGGFGGQRGWGLAAQTAAGTLRPGGCDSDCPAPRSGECA